MIITGAGLDVQYVDAIQSDVFHKYCKNTSVVTDLTLMNTLIRVILQLSEAAVHKSFKGSTLTVGADSVTFGKQYTTPTPASTPASVTTPKTPEEKKEVPVSKPNPLPKKTVISDDLDLTSEEKKREIEVDREVRRYRQEQMESIKQQMAQYKLVEEEKVKKEIKQMRQTMIRELQREQQELENDMRKQVQEREIKNIVPVSKSVIVRERSINLDSSHSSQPYEKQPKQEKTPEEPPIPRQQYNDLNERLITTELKYEKLLSDIKEQLSKKKKEVERLEEENLLLAKRLKKLKSQKLTDGLEELDREDVSSQSIKSLHNLLASSNTGDEEDEDIPNFSTVSTASSFESRAKDRASLPVPKAKFVAKVEPVVDEPIHDDVIQVDDPTLLEMSDSDSEAEQDGDPFGGVQLETPVFRTATSRPIHRSFDDEEELFESSHSDLKKSSTQKKKSKKTIFGSAINE